MGALNLNDDPERFLVTGY